MLRVAIVSTSVPPAASGQARVLGHLLRGRPAESTLLASDQLGFLAGIEHRHHCGRYRELPAPVLELPGPARLFSRLPDRMQVYARMAAATWRRAREICRVLRDDPPAALVACSGNPYDIPASCIASVRMGVPLVVYLFDDPVFQWPEGELRTIARFWEGLWIRRARAIIAPNEFVIDDLNARHRASVTIVRNPITGTAFPAVVRPWPVDPAGPIRIVYTGSVYHAQADAFRNLVQAIEKREGRYQLHIYTSQPQSALDDAGVTGRCVIRHDHVDGDEVHAVQQSADLLFLPLAFHSTIQEVLRTSAPAKTGEYLAAGRPVLVHAPKGSFVCSFFATNEAGYVVDEPDPGRLTAALDRIENDADFRRRTIENARRVASEFHVDRSRERFWSVLSSLT